MLSHVGFAFVHVLHEGLQVLEVDVLHEDDRLLVVEVGRPEERLKLE